MEYWHFGTISISEASRKKLMLRSRISTYFLILTIPLLLFLGYLFLENSFLNSGLPEYMERQYVLGFSIPIISLCMFVPKLASMIPLLGIASEIANKASSELDLDQKIEKRLRNRLMFEPWSVSIFHDRIPSRLRVAKIGSLIDSRNEDGFWIMRTDDDLRHISIERMQDGFTRANYEEYIKTVTHGK